VEVVVQETDVVDPDLVAERLEDVQIRVGAALDALVLAEELGRERDSRAPLPDTRRPVEEIGVRGPFRQRRPEQSLRLGLFWNAIEA